MTFSKVFLYFCFSFIAGIFLSSFRLFFPVTLAGFFIIIGIFLAIVFLKRNNKIIILSICLVLIFLGAWRHQISMEKIINNDFIRYNDKEESITIKGKLNKEADVRDKTVNLEIKADYILKGNEKIKITGKVLITAPRYPVYNYGDDLEIKGEPKTPPVFESFNYKNFLAKDRIFSVIYFPEIKKTGENKGNFIFSKILYLKEGIRRSIYANFSPPQGPLLGALILGDQRKIPNWFREDLNVTGVSHITSVSGMHVAIISALLMEFLLGIGFWRGQAFYMTLIFLAFFILIVGFPAPAVRAGIMGGLFLLGQKIGRKSTSFRSIIFAAVLLLAVNPLLLKFDISFQLSFLAVMGLIFLEPIFRKLLKKIPDKDFFNLRTMISMTFSAQILTLPVLIYNFGQISLIAPISNILILPFIPLLTILGFLLGFLGMFSQFIASFISFPCWLVLTYIVSIIKWLSEFSFSYLKLENVSFLWLVLFYLVLIFSIRFLRERWKLDFLNY